jgi:glycosyltransferase involved in cell wall biosynthesis
MNVVVVNDYATVRGGSDQVALAGARAMADRGCNVHFFAPASSEKSPLLLHPNIVAHCLGQADLLGGRNRLASALRGLWNQSVANRLASILESFSPANTIVHVHGWTKAVTTAVFPMLEQRGFQPIVTFHDYFVACPNGVFFDYPAGVTCQRVPLSLSCLRCQCDRRSYAQKLWRVARQALQKGFGGVPRNLRHAIVISRHSEAVLDPYLPKTTARYFVANPNEVPREPRVEAEHNEFLLYVGRLTAEKAPDHLAEAAAALALPVRFVGEGPLRGRLRRTNPAAEITGWVERETIARYFKAARVLVFPSIWHEAAPLTTGEALGRGVPVLVSDKCAAVEQVIPGVNGFLFRGGDVRDLQEKLASFSDPALVRQLSEGAYTHYWERPATLEAHGRALKAVYENVLAAQQVNLPVIR